MYNEKIHASLMAALPRPRDMLIGGQWVQAQSGETIPVEDPATGQVITSIPAGDAADVDAAVRSARASFEAGVWRNLSGEKRAEVLWKFSELILENAAELSHLEVLDNGMPFAFANATMTTAVNGIRYHAGWCTKLYGQTTQMGEFNEFHSYSVMEPVGVVGLITPWNGPLAMACTKLAPALAAGCSVVLKPAEQTSLTALRLGELLIEAGMPEGVVNIVTGLGTAAGEALITHDDVNKISFTGSTATGKHIVRAASGNLKRVTLELGGKSPVFVFDDADLASAIPAAGMGIFANSGQVCYAGSRVYAQPGIYDRLVEGLSAFADRMKVGSGFDKDTMLGPLISRRQQERVQHYIDSGLTDGAELLYDGKSPAGDGYFMAPTIFGTDGLEARISREEIFGPVLTISRFESLDNIRRIGNATPYGLGAGIYTQNLSNAHKAARLLDAGNVWVNHYGRLDRSLPFGGFKQSGWGRENGTEGVKAFMEAKSVYVKM